MIGIVPRFTIIAGSALGVDLDAEKLARHYCLHVEVITPPCHPRSKTVPPFPSESKWLLASTRHWKKADMVLNFTNFQPENNLCFGGTGWTVDMAKLLRKVLYVYDVDKNIWFWYRHDRDLFYACDQISQEQFALPTFVQRTAIVGVRNIYDYPDALLELQETFKLSLKTSSF